MQKRAVLKIYGKVQGVFFRDSVRMEARKLNLVGWTRNEPDGAVQIVAEGKDKDLNSLIEWCKYGPDNAEVEKVEVQWEKPRNDFGDFMIK